MSGTSKQSNNAQHNNTHSLTATQCLTIIDSNASTVMLTSVLKMVHLNSEILKTLSPVQNHYT